MNNILDEDINEQVTQDLLNEYGDKALETANQQEKKITYSKFIDSEEISEDEDIGSNKSKLDFGMITKLINDKSHLPGYDIFDKDLGLIGDAYDPMKKNLYYYQNSLKQKTKSYKINNQCVIDNRSHMLVVCGPGAGKTTIKNQIKNVMKDFSGTDGVIEVSSASHPEQLIGKIVYEGRGKSRKPVEKIGVLGYKCVMNDEAQDLLNEKNEIYAKSQRIKRLGMDTYGYNKISKKLVEDSPENILEYYSPSNVCDFAHPVKLHSCFFDTGSFRRYFAYNITQDTKINLDKITSFDFEEDKSDVWKIFLNSLYENDVEVTFDKQTLDIIAHFHKCLLNYLLRHKNPNAFRYAILTRYSMRDVFAKYTFILSGIRKEKIPSIYTTLSACSDVVLFILKSIETYNSLGNMGTSADFWGGCGEQDAQALEYLFKHKCLSRDTSNVSIKKFQSLLAHFYGCKVTQSRAHYYRLKRDGFVNSSQEGKYDSRVWLTFIPDDVKIENEQFDSLEFWENMLKGVGQKNSFLTALKSLFTDDKSYEKYQGVGGVGVLGCIMIKYILCVEVFEKKKKKNNIYISEGVSPSPLSPLTFEDDTASVNNKKKGVKTLKNRPTPLKSDREVQFYETEECQDIKPQTTKEQIKEFLTSNPQTTGQELYEKFGTGALKFRNELKSEGLI